MFQFFCTHVLGSEITSQVSCHSGQCLPPSCRHGIHLLPTSQKRTVQRFQEVLSCHISMLFGRFCFRFLSRKSLSGCEPAICYQTMGPTHCGACKSCDFCAHLNFSNLPNTCFFMFVMSLGVKFFPPGNALPGWKLHSVCLLLLTSVSSMQSLLCERESHLGCAFFGVHTSRWLGHKRPKCFFFGGHQSRIQKAFFRDT